MAIPWTEPNPILPLALFLVGIAACLGLGRLVMRALRVTGGDPALRTAVALAIGMPVLGLFTLAVGLLGGLGILPYLLAFPALLGLVGVVALRGGGGASPRRERTNTQTVLLGFLGLTGLICLLTALAPAGGNDWDGLSYHLAAPAIWLAHGRIDFLPWDHHSNFPFLHEMLYLAGLAISGQGLAKLFHLLAGAVTCLTLFGMVRPRYGMTAGLLAAAVFASAPIVAWEAGVAFSDLALAMYLAVALGCWLAWREGSGDRWLALCGLAVGGALGVKVIAGVAAVTFAAMTLARARVVPSHRKAGMGCRLALLALPALVLALPWYLKTYLWTGNPVYPFLYDTLGGRWWSAALAQGYRAEQLGFGMGRSLPMLLLAPVNLTLLPAMFGNLPGHPLIYNSLGPLFLALAPLGLIARWRQPLARSCALVAATWLLAWFILCQHLRYALPALAPTAVLAAVGAVSVLAARPGRVRLAARVVIGLALVISLAVNVWSSTAQVRTTLGLVSQEEYLAAAFPEYPLFAWANANLPPESRVALVGETRGFYLQRPYVWADHSTWLQVSDTQGAQDLLRCLHRRGITHLLASSAYLQSAMRRAQSGNEDALLEALERGRLRVIQERRGNALLEVRGG